VHVTMMPLPMTELLFGGKLGKGKIRNADYQ